MYFTFGTFITNILFSCILVITITCLLKNNKIIYNKTIKLMLLCILFIVFKMVVPIEFFFTKSIRIKSVLPNFYNILNISLFNDIITIKTLLLFLWLGVALIKGILTLYKYSQFRKLLELIPNISNSKIDSMLKQLNPAGKIIQVKQLDIFSPVIIDPIKPVIILPKKNLSNEELFFILKHEVNHYKHYDLWLKLIIEILQIVYWWNPFVILLHKQINKVTEINNDLTITKDMNSEQQLNYLTCLLNMADCKKAETPKFLLAFTENNKSNIKQRFNIILNNNSPQKTGIFVIYIVILLTVGSFFFNFEPDYPVPQDGHVIENTNETYILYKDNKYYFILNGENMGVVGKPETSDLPIIIEEREVIYETD